MAVLQREEPVDASGRTHGIRHQADVRFGHQRWPERQLYEVQLTSGCGWAVSLRQRLLPSRANWRYRPIPARRRASKLPDDPLGSSTFRICEAAVRGLQRSAIKSQSHQSSIRLSHAACCGSRRLQPTQKQGRATITLVRLRGKAALLESPVFAVRPQMSGEDWSGLAKMQASRVKDVLNNAVQKMHTY